MLESELNGATLHAAGRTPWSFRVSVSLGEAVVHRIGVNDERGGAHLLRQISLHAAKIFSVADEDDLAANVNALVGKSFEVFGAPVVGVNNIRSYVAGRRVAGK